MPNLVEQLTPNYFNEFFNGALFLRGEDILQVQSVGASGVAVRRWTEESVDNADRVPYDFFTGYKVFEYPILGYRKIDDHRIVYIARQQSVQRGVRPNLLRNHNSPATQLLRAQGVASSVGSAELERRRVVQAFKPRFDSLSDLPKLLNGEVFGLVLSPSVMIEPSVDNANDWYTVYYKQSAVGKINSRGSVTWTSSSFSSLLPELG